MIKIIKPILVESEQVKPDVTKWSAWECDPVVCGKAEDIAKIFRWTVEETESFLQAKSKDGRAKKSGEIWFYSEDPKGVKKAAEGWPDNIVGRPIGQ